MTAESVPIAMSDPVTVLNEVYGYPSFRGSQADIIDAAVAGRDCLVLMPTGGGKSLCYQIPSLVRPGVGLVVSPLIALMKDQVAALKQLGIAAAYLNSTLDAAEQRLVLEQLHQGELKLLYVAPERLLKPGTLDRLSQLEIALIAIDEAHCVSQWGHDFRPDYLSLNQLAERFPGVPRMALTATADGPTREEMVQRLALHQPASFISPFDRPNIRYSVQPKSDGRRQLSRFLEGHRNESGIVYCLSRKSVDATARWLNTHGFNALPYHAGLSTSERNSNQERFLREDDLVIVATIAFGMGIDKPDVRFVAHLDLPRSIEAYYQETGRAGRDGEPADAWMIYGLQDVVRLRLMLEESDAGEAKKRVERAKLDALLGWCEVTDCRRRSLLAYFDDDYPGDCGNCDTCLSPPKQWDATVAAQKLLSCIYRTGQRFGAVHVIDVLRGSENTKVQQNGHHRLSTYGIGKELAAGQWRSVVRQLIVQGFIRVDPERYNALALTPDSRALLRGETQVTLRQDTVPESRAPSRRKTSTSARQQGPLWEALRDCRRRLAEQSGVPPYVVFHDATLSAMAEHRPVTAEELLEISGVGQKKLERYGEVFMDVIRQHVRASAPDPDRTV